MIKIKVWDKKENKYALKICKLTKEMKEEHPHESEYHISRRSNKENIYNKTPKEIHRISYMMGACQVLIDNVEDSRLTLYKIIKNQMQNIKKIELSPSIANTNHFCKNNESEECKQWNDVNNFMRNKICPQLNEVTEYLTFLYNKGFKSKGFYNILDNLFWKYIKHCESDR